MPEYIDVTYIKKQIADCKRAIQSSHSDYLMGYVSALSATEGVIAEAPTADVVEVVRCKECRHYNTSCCNSGLGWCEFYNTGATDEHYCSHGERKEVINK